MSDKHEHQRRIIELIGDLKALLYDYLDRDDTDDDDNDAAEMALISLQAHEDYIEKSFKIGD